MAAVAEMANRPSPWLERGYERVEGVKQSRAHLRARAIEQWLASGGATRRWALSSDGSGVARCFAWLGQGERSERG